MTFISLEMNYLIYSFFDSLFNLYSRIYIEISLIIDG